jgi:hypothetical protein
MATVKIKTSPLLILLTVMFLLFLSGFLLLRRDWRRKDVTGLKRFFTAPKLTRVGQDEQNFSRLTLISCDILWALNTGGLYAATVAERNYEVTCSLE